MVSKDKGQRNKGHRTGFSYATLNFLLGGERRAQAEPRPAIAGAWGPVAGTWLSEFSSEDPEFLYMQQ